MYKLNSFEEFEVIKPKLLQLDLFTEERVFNLYKNKKDQDLQFQNGRAVNLVHSDDIGLGSKMALRLRNVGDITYFWNSIDPNNREILLRSVGLSSVGIGMDFFVWFANNYTPFKGGVPLKTPLSVYFDANETQKRDWLAEYAETMKEFPTY